MSDGCRDVWLDQEYNAEGAIMKGWEKLKEHVWMEGPNWLLWILNSRYSWHKDKPSAGWKVAQDEKSQTMKGGWEEASGGWLSIVVQLSGEIYQWYTNQTYLGLKIVLHVKQSVFYSHVVSSNSCLMSLGLDFSGDNDIIWLSQHQLLTIPPLQQV